MSVGAFLFCINDRRCRRGVVRARDIRVYLSPRQDIPSRGWVSARVARTLSRLHILCRYGGWICVRDMSGGARDDGDGGRRAGGYCAVSQGFAPEDASMAHAPACEVVQGAALARRQDNI